MSSLPRTSLRIAALCAAVSLASPVLAQGGAGGGGGGGQPGGNRGGGERVVMGGGPGGGGMGMFGDRNPFDPPIESAQLDRYAKILGLDADQKTAAQALLEAQIGEFNPAAKAAREKMEAARESFRESRDPSVWRDMGAVFEDLRTKRSAVEKQFFTDVKSLLTDEQAAKFPIVERTHRRDTTLARGFMSGERVDLIQLVDKAGLTDQQKADLKATLEQYEVDLDRELVKRNEMYEEGMKSMREAMEKGGGPMAMMDDPKMQELFTKGRDAAIKVRDTNRRFARQLESAMPDDKRTTFADEVRRQSFPMIYRPTYASRVIEAAEKMTDLSDAQKSSLTAMKDSFAREIGAMNTQLEAATLESEESWTPGSMMRGGGNEKTDGLRKSRRELVDGTVSKVRELLSEEQRAKLPERNEEFGQGGPGQRAGDDGDRPRRRRDRGEGGGDVIVTPAPPPPANPR